MIISAYYQHLVSAARQTGLPFTAVAQQCYDRGLRGVDIILSDINDECLQHVDAMRAMGYSVCSVPAMTDFLHNPSLEEAEHIVSTAHTLGATVIMAIPGFFNEGEDREAARRRSLPAIEHMCRIAEPYGIRIGVEGFDHPLSGVAGVEGVGWYLTALPALHCIFDTGNFAFMGDDTLAAYKQFRDRIRYQVHCNDRSLTPPANTGARTRPDGVSDYPVAVGCGDIPHKAILTDLRARGFDGIVTIENFGSPRALEDLLTSIDYIKTVLEG